jgi:hypothetical protein
MSAPLIPSGDTLTYAFTAHSTSFRVQFGPRSPPAPRLFFVADAASPASASPARCGVPAEAEEEEEEEEDEEEEEEEEDEEDEEDEEEDNDEPPLVKPPSFPIIVVAIVAKVCVIRISGDSSSSFSVWDGREIPSQMSARCEPKGEGSRKAMGISRKIRRLEVAKALFYASQFEIRNFMRPLELALLHSFALIDCKREKAAVAGVELAVVTAIADVDVDVDVAVDAHPGWCSGDPELRVGFKVAVRVRVSRAG